MSKKYKKHFNKPSYLLQARRFEKYIHYLMCELTLDVFHK